MFIFTVPDSPPSSVIIRSITNTTISIGWEPIACPDRNSKIAGYRVSYGPTVSYPEAGEESGVIQDFSFTMRNRQPNTSYSFQVMPVLEFGQGVDGTVPRTGPVSVWTQVN